MRGLTPLHVMAQAMPRHPTLSSLAMLKTEWGVSIRSLIRRARELGYINQDRATSLYKQISARGWNKSEPGYVAQEKPRAFRKLAELYYGPGPNVERLADDAGWSQELAFYVLGQYATRRNCRTSRRHLRRTLLNSHSAGRGIKARGKIEHSQLSGAPPGLTRSCRGL
jgi:hypothetical protein